MFFRRLLFIVPFFASSVLLGVKLKQKTLTVEKLQKTTPKPAQFENLPKELQYPILHPYFASGSYRFALGSYQLEKECRDPAKNRCIPKLITKKPESADTFEAISNIISLTPGVPSHHSVIANKNVWFFNSAENTLECLSKKTKKKLKSYSLDFIKEIEKSEDFKVVHLSFDPKSNCFFICSLNRVYVVNEANGDGNILIHIDDFDTIRSVDLNNEEKIHVWMNFGDLYGIEKPSYLTSISLETFRKQFIEEYDTTSKRINSILKSLESFSSLKKAKHVKYFLKEKPTLFFRYLIRPAFGAELLNIYEDFIPNHSPTNANALEGACSLKHWSIFRVLLHLGLDPRRGKTSADSLSYWKTKNVDTCTLKAIKKRISYLNIYDQFLRRALTHNNKPKTHKTNDKHERAKVSKQFIKICQKVASTNSQKAKKHIGSLLKVFNENQEALFKELFKDSKMDSIKVNTFLDALQNAYIQNDIEFDSTWRECINKLWPMVDYFYKNNVFSERKLLIISIESESFAMFYDVLERYPILKNRVLRKINSFLGWTPFHCIVDCFRIYGEDLETEKIGKMLKLLVWYRSLDNSTKVNVSPSKSKDGNEKKYESTPAKYFEKTCCSLTEIKEFKENIIPLLQDKVLSASGKYVKENKNAFEEIETFIEKMNKG